jgi:hypothetical protein
MNRSSANTGLQRRPGLQRFMGLLALIGLVACTTPKTPPESALHLQGVALQMAGTRALQRGELAAARTAYLAALAAAESIEDFSAAGSALLNLAVVQARLGQRADAHERLNRLLQSPLRFPAALQHQAAARKALLWVDEGANAEALRWADAAEAGCAAPCPVAPAMDNLRAHLALGRGDAPAAAAAAQRAAAAAAVLALPAEQANALRLAGRAALVQGDADAAATVLAQALKIDQALGLPERIALDLQFAAQAEVLRGQAAAAREFYARAAVVREALGDTLGAQALRAQAARLAVP